MKTVSGNKQDNKTLYEKIDAHARKAPKSLKNSVEDLVTYMSSFSKEPRTLARGLFVWISDNIRYDVEGFFGMAPMASCDALSVMQGGTSFCEGYANVMETLCRQANIPVKKLSGYAKGVGCSADQPVSLAHETNHAWNAIQLDGKWHLLDSTWGAGHVDGSNFVKKFDEFYFLTDPAHFVHSHFPYMDGNLTESMKWQLLENPVSLEEFNKNVQYKSAAFKLGLKAASHPYGCIHMQDEIEMIFKSTKAKDVVVCARLWLKEEKNWLKEQLNATLSLPGHDNETYILLVHPPKAGKYTLNVFCETDSDEKNEGSTSAMDYVINCTNVKEHDFEYPLSYSSTRTEKTILHEPLRGKLQRNKMISFKITAPYLQHMKVGKTHLEKTGDTFTGKLKTGWGGELEVYGTREGEYSTYWGLYKFKII